MVSSVSNERYAELMSQVENRETFISFEELFHSFSEQCFSAEQALRRTLQQADEPYSEGLKLVADAQHSLGQELRNCADQGPENLLATRLQYTLEQPRDAEADTAGAAVKGITRLNRELESVLKDLVDKTPQESISEMIDALRREVDTVNRKISMIRVSMQDV